MVMEPTSETTTIDHNGLQDIQCNANKNQGLAKWLLTSTASTKTDCPKLPGHAMAHKSPKVREYRIKIKQNNLYSAPTRVLQEYIVDVNTCS